MVLDSEGVRAESVQIAKGNAAEILYKVSSFRS